MKIHPILAILCGLTAVALHGEPAIDAGKKTNSFIQVYFRIKPADRIAELFKDCDNMFTASQEQQAAPPLVGFFHEVFKANPGRLDEWLDDIAKLKSPKLKKLLVAAMLLSNTPESRTALANAAKKYPELRITAPTGPLSLQDITALNQLPPDMLDYCWGAFFASGDPKYVQAILRTAAIPDGDSIRLNAHAARWSAVSIAGNTPEVKALLENFFKTADAEQKKAFADYMDEATQNAYFGAVLVTDSRRQDNALLPGDSLAPRPEQLRPTAAAVPRPLPAPGPAVDYRRQPPQNIRELRAIEQDLRGQHGIVIVKGRISIDGKSGAGRLMTRAHMLDGGVFIAGVEPGHTLRFALHPYEPLDFYIAPELAGQTVDLGNQVMHEIPQEQRGKAVYKGKLPANSSSKIIATLYAAPTPPITATPDTADEMKPAIIECRSGDDGAIMEIDGLAPMDYTLEVRIFGYMPLLYHFTGEQNVIDLGETAFTAAPHLNFSFRPFNDKNAAWRSEDVFVDGKTPLQLAPNNLCGEVALILTPDLDLESGRVLAEFTQGDARWYDLGDAEPDSAPPDLKPFDNAKLLVAGRYYRITSENGSFDLLLRMTAVDADHRP
ncbi:MAG: hypothetical protein PHI85_08825 [Victivallaceae bacterium]|nr:hypothetical protein [Victivallaceae bacterium]